LKLTRAWLGRRGGKGSDPRGDTASIALSRHLRACRPVGREHAESL